MTVTHELDAAARQEITELYARYTHAFDDNSPQDLADLFTDDGTFVRDGAEPVHGRAALAELVRGVAARGAGGRHLVSSVVVEPSATGASGSAYVQVISIGADTVRLVVIGRYHDEFARSEGRWRFRSRRFTSFTGAGLAGATIAAAAEAG
ncbi:MULTISPECIES: nuclear transport factor 2 family protein [unclassified Frankia]|uniref:nuclear transport factor 2 family protein n=1 Tax=unclassified Frankia TaxID=2632575 RepID=UPI0020242DF5